MTCGKRIVRNYGEAEYRFSGSRISLNPDFKQSDAAFQSRYDEFIEQRDNPPYDDLGDLEAELHEDADDEVIPLDPEEEEQLARELDGE